MAERFSHHVRAFCDHYLRIWNGTNAAILAGYSVKTAYSKANKLLKREDVQAYIKEKLDEKAMGADEVLMRLGEQARAEYAQFITESGDLDMAALIKAGKGHLIKKIEKNGSKIRVEFYDAQHALELLGKHHKLFVEMNEVVNRLNVIGMKELLDKVYGNGDSDSTGS